MRNSNIKFEEYQMKSLEFFHCFFGYELNVNL